jgi:hypothetical protein
METDARVFNYCSLTIDTILIWSMMASCSILIQKIKPYFAGGSNVHMYFTYVVDTDDYNTLFKMIFIYDILKQPSRMKQQ